MAKKKKIVTNPNRGFATTSVASKPKPEKQIQSESLPAKSDQEDSSTATPAEHGGTGIGEEKQEKELHELSPDELERRLEEGELQGLVDKLSSKCARDASRHASKLQTDYRVLRKQTQPLYTRSLLPDDLMLRILALAKQDVDGNASPFVESSSGAAGGLKEDDRVAQVWTLQQSLVLLGFDEKDIDAAIEYLLQYPPFREQQGVAWGLEHALDWLMLHLDDKDLPTIDEQSGQARIRSKEAQEPETDLNSLVESSALSGQENKCFATKTNATKTDSEAEAGSETPDTPPSSVEDFEVSDLDSDLDPDELLSTYITTKSRLYEVQPGLVDTKAQKSRSSLGIAQSRNAMFTSSVKKLQAKMERIESDVLFDKREADDRWFLTRNHLAQEAAERRRLRLPSREHNVSVRKFEAASTTKPARSAQPAEIEIGHSDDTDASDDDNAFGDMFAAVTGPGTGTSLSSPANGATMHIRDFGQTSGIGARRILEEACRARDSRVRLTYKLISTTAFSNRHLLLITWSKDQDLTFPLQVEQSPSQASARACAFTMKSVACPDAKQSEAYVSVLALFQIFNASPREANAYLRLPPTWRDYYLELSNRRKQEVEAADRDSLRLLRDKVRSKIDSEPDQAEEDVIHTRNFQKRLEDSERGESRHERTERRDPDPQELQQLWQAKSSTATYEQMLQFRMTLPMYGFREAALSAVDQNQVTIICGETGCGKSTQFPQYILEHQLKQGKPCKVYCTEPRRISAITLAQRVSQELGEHKADVGTLRSLVGYAIRLESQTSRSTRLIYATTGIVLRMLESGDGLRDVTHIVIDEVHERSIETDFLLIILRSLMAKRPDLKVVLMSATVDAQRFASYFSGAPILNVPGRTFPVDCKFLEDAIQATGYVVDGDDPPGNEEDESDGAIKLSGQDQEKTASDSLSLYKPSTRRTLSQFDEYRIPYNLLLALINEIAFGTQYQEYSKAILVFLPGIAEIKQMNDLLSATPLAQRYLVHSLHSAIPSEDQQRAFDPPPHGLRKIVLSTNIAETGVTIPDVTCVIDTGKHKEMRFDERRQISRLIESFISRANAKQRRGRAGRVQAGLCFHLFTKHRHDNVMSTEQTPEMLRLSLQDLVMRVKICKLGDIQSTLADALDPPSAKNVRRAIDALIEVDALTTREELTPLGQQLSKLPLDPYLGKLVLYGAVFSCLDVAVTLAAILTSKSPFTSPLNARHAADLARATFSKSDSDLLTDYNAYASWRRVCTTNPHHEAQFCRRSFLSSQTLSGIEDLKAQFLSQLTDGGLITLTPSERHSLSRIQNSSSRPGRRTFVAVPPHLDANTDNTTLITTVIAWAFYPKLLVRDGKGWRNTGTSQAIAIHPTSILRSPTAGTSETLARVKLLSFYSILQSAHGARNYNASSLTPVSPLALLLLAGDASFNAYTCVVSIDGARLRFLVEARPATAQSARDLGAAKTLVAVRFLRRRMEEMVAWRWRQQRRDLPAHLARWWEVWEAVCDAWAKRPEGF